MSMHNPPHPGEFISGIYLEPNNISGRELAEKLGVAASTLSRVLNGASRVTPEMALRLSKAIGRETEPESISGVFRVRGQAALCNSSRSTFRKVRSSTPSRSLMCMRSASLIRVW